MVKRVGPIQECGIIVNNMTKNLFNLSKEIVVITGANGLLGSEFSKTLIQYGARVVKIDKKIKAVKNKKYLSINADVTSESSLKNACKYVKSFFGVPTSLINCAAVNMLPNSSNSDNSFEKYSIDNYQKTMDVNVKGTFLSCQVFGSEMAKKRKGSIINLSSIYGIVSPDHSIYQANGKYYKPIDYSISKSAIINLTKYLAVYWSKKNVRVNNLVLGGVMQGQDKNFINRYSKKVPLGRLANKDEFNSTIIYLISPSSSYITGSNLVIDGGWTAW